MACRRSPVRARLAPWTGSPAQAGFSFVLSFRGDHRDAGGGSAPQAGRSLARSTAPCSEDRDGVERRPGAARDAQRRGHDQERPATRPLADRAKILELQVVEQVHAHRVECEDVDGKATPSVVLGAVSLLPSDPRAATPRSATNGIAVGCRPAFAVAVSHGPSSARRRACPVRTRRMSPSRTVTPCAASAASRSPRNTCSPVSSQGAPRSGGMSRRTPRPTSPFARTSTVSALAPWM